MKLIDDLELPARAAKALGIPQRSLAAAVQDGSVPSYRLTGGTVLVRISEVKAWDQQRQHRPGRPSND